ncbi:hypothetical protein ACP70R_036983 [Stipagrostis hirtigluma subsp. patula]
MAAVESVDRHCSAKHPSPPSGRLVAAPPPQPSSRTPLHGFEFPTLSWGTHRLLRCAKNPASSPPPAAPETPSPEKEKAHHRPAGDGCGSLQRQRDTQRPWNLRARRRSAAAAPPQPEGSDDAAAAEPAPTPRAGTKKRRFSIVLSKEEIAEDFLAIRGARPPRRPKKRPRLLQRQLDSLYPGLCLADVTPDSYRIEEVIGALMELAEDGRSFQMFSSNFVSSDF